MSETRADYHTHLADDEMPGFICLADGPLPLDFVAACLRSEAMRRALTMGMSDPDGYARWVARRYGMDVYTARTDATQMDAQVMPHAHTRHAQ